MEIELAVRRPFRDTGSAKILVKIPGQREWHEEEWIRRRSSSRVPTLVELPIELLGNTLISETTQSRHQVAGKMLKSGLAVLRPLRIEIEPETIGVKVIERERPQLIRTQAGE